MRLCRQYGTLPEEGGMLDQPLALVLVGTRLLDFEDAYATFLSCERGKQPVPADVLKLVTTIQAKSALERLS